MLWRPIGVLMRRATLALMASGALASASLVATAQQGWVKRNERMPDRAMAPGVTEPIVPTMPLELDLQAVADGLDRIEAGVEVVQEARIAAEPVTDVVIRLRHAMRRFRTTAAGQPGEAERSYVEAQVLIVTRGRINPPGLAQCDRFDGDVLVCTIECEGGTFGLRRGGQGEHFLLVGGGGIAGDRGPGRPGFRIGSCAARGAVPPLSLMPRAGRLAAEIKLIEKQ